MSVDVDWDALTTGPDGIALAESIRDFVHARFQHVALPRFIQSVTVHSFDFGSTPPEVELKDVSDPLPDFYERGEGGGSDDDEDEEDEEEGGERAADASSPAPARPRRPSDIDTRLAHARFKALSAEAASSPVLGVNTPGIPGGTSNLGYFHLPLAAGLSGRQTPLATVAGAHSSTTPVDQAGFSDPAGSPSRPSTSDSIPLSHSTFEAVPEPVLNSVEDAPAHALPAAPRVRERRPEDFQVVARVRYAGDVRLSLTAEILLDYPMPSFVGIPVRLNVTGMSFDGVAVLAYFRRRAHFCFLSPDDAHALLPDEAAEAGPLRPDETRDAAPRMGGLLQEIKVESEIGQRENGKQSLRNVGKVERFVLEQVRRIFADEFVYPSFWTFLV
ncbi:MAG: Mitochondrial distribution and morphology protein 12 [Thelocarpon impressellum]|nr:MAG: Mitochondrial distribution and morphology protein 12 [Thelocarpon impressellum]